MEDHLNSASMKENGTPNDAKMARMSRMEILTSKKKSTISVDIIPVSNGEKQNLARIARKRRSDILIAKKQANILGRVNKVDNTGLSIRLSFKSGVCLMLTSSSISNVIIKLTWLSIWIRSFALRYLIRKLIQSYTRSSLITWYMVLAVLLIFIPRAWLMESAPTIIDDQGYPVYKRRDTDSTIEKNGVPLDNRFIVPYNRYMLFKYQAHINVEYCNQSRAIKYLFKYTSKGNDRITARFSTSGVDGERARRDDEIKRYIDCRYISACEAVWRIIMFDIHYRSVAVERLPFHLEGEHNCFFRDGDNFLDVINKPSSSESKFLAWMEMNKSFKPACYALGLLDDYKEYIDGITKASS
ncbi:hypothetical protein OROHE_002657 [Orobanche hederae]